MQENNSSSYSIKYVRNTTKIKIVHLNMSSLCLQAENFFSEWIWNDNCFI